MTALERILLREIEASCAREERLRAALEKIAEKTGSDDPCWLLVQIARDVLAETSLEPPE